MGLDILFSRKLIYMNLLLKQLPFVNCLHEQKILEEITKKKMPLQIRLLNLIMENNYTGIPNLKLQQILQVSILLITNYMATIKISFKKDRKVFFFYLNILIIIYLIGSIF